MPTFTPIKKYDELSAQNKIYVCRTRIFMLNQFIGHLAIQFEVKQDDSIQDVEFQDNYLLFSEKINDLKLDQLMLILTTKMCKHIFPNTDDIFIFSLVNYTFKNYSQVSSFFNDYFNQTFEQNNPCKIISNYQFNSSIKEQFLNFALNYTTPRMGDLANFFYKSIYFKDISNDIFIKDSQMYKCQKIIEHIKHINTIKDPKEQLEKLNILLSVPPDLACFALAYLLHINKTILSTILDDSKLFYDSFWSYVKNVVILQ